MVEHVATINYLLAVGTVLLGLLLIIAGMTRLATGAWFPPSVERHVRRFSLHTIAGMGVFAVVMSFWYSDVVGYTPCPLCWLARTMMFPLAIVGVVAAWRSDRRAWPYMVALSAVGMLITGYHHLYQMELVSGAACNALEGAGDCAKRLVFEFDFVTLPLMGFVLFGAIAFLGWFGREDANA